MTEKFKTFDQLESYLSGVGYGLQLDKIVELVRQSLSISKTTWRAGDLILAWWNENQKEPTIKGYRLGYFLIYHLKKEIGKE